MSFESHKQSEKCTRNDLRGSKIHKFPGGACPQTPLQEALLCTVHFEVYYRGSVLMSMVSSKDFKVMGYLHMDTHIIYYIYAIP